MFGPMKWISFLNISPLQIIYFLFCVIFWFGTIFGKSSDINKMCPINCTCHFLEQQASSLIIDCQQRLEELIAKDLREEIDAILLATDRLTQLNIRNTKIKSIPKELCNQIHLRTINVSHNRIEALPDNCLIRLGNLQEFSADSNKITHLQDGLFDGLMHLQKLSFNTNQIKSIGLHVFTNTSDLPSLSFIKLNQNRLTEIEPWMFMRARVMPNISVEIVENSIKRFTNVIGWNSSCQPGRSPSRKIKMTINLSYNLIEHLSDLISSLQFNGLKHFLCWFMETNMQIAGGEFLCDCLDFTYLSAAKMFSHTAFLNEVYCDNKLGVQKRSALEIPLEELVCEVFEHCPTKCQCISQPSNSTFHVKCSATNQNNIPTTLPNPDQPQSVLMPQKRKMYQLDFSYNNISSLQSRDFFLKTLALDLSYSNVKNITEEAWLQLIYVEKIYLHNNQLTTLPLVANSTNISFVILSLYNNPWSCSCDQVWMKSWLSSVYDRLENPSAIQCDSPLRLRGRSVLSLNDTESCSEPLGNNFTLIVILNSTLIPLATFVVIIISILKTCRVKVFRKLGLHPFDRDECEGEEMDFDVFIAFAHEDSVKAKQILNVLEENLCKVCFHQRDFLAGQLIMDNITEAIFKSKRVLCLVSEQFIASDYCMEEFHMALYHNIRIKRQRVIVMISSDFQRQFSENTELYQNDDSRMALLPSQIPLDDSLAGVRQTVSLLKEYIARYTFVDSEAEEWKDQLLYAMPVNRLLHTNT